MVPVVQQTELLVGVESDEPNPVMEHLQLRGEGLGQSGYLDEVFAPVTQAGLDHSSQSNVLASLYLKRGPKNECCTSRRIPGKQLASAPSTGSVLDPSLLASL